MANNVLTGKYLFCKIGLKIIRQSETIVTWEFQDYSWPCNSCKEIHCSSCFYYNDEKDSEIIIVEGCGKFWQKK